MKRVLVVLFLAACGLPERQVDCQMRNDEGVWEQVLPHQPEYTACELAEGFFAGGAPF